MSENEIQSYEVPDISGINEPEAAAAALSKMDADAGGNTRHPITNRSHPQNKAFTEARTRLFQIKNPEPAPQTNADGQEIQQKYSHEQINAMGDALEQQQQKKTDITAEARALHDSLVKDFNFEPLSESKLKDIPEYQLRSWRMQKLAEEGNYEALSPVMSKELRALNTPQDVTTAFQLFSDASDLDPTLRHDISARIIQFIHDANKQLAGNR